MKILSDTEEVIHKMEMDLDDSERNLLCNHTIDTISEEDYENLLIEWAVIDILKQALDTYEKDNGIT